MTLVNDQKQRDLTARENTPRPNAVDLSVVVTCTEDAESLPRALGHLEVQTYPAGRFEILIVDESPQGEIHKTVKRFADGTPVRTRCLRGHHQNGPSSEIEALNRTVQEARGHWLLFLDQDLLAGPHLVESHIREQEAHGGAVAVLGRIEHHPQVDQGVTTKWCLADQNGERETGNEIPFYDWRLSNLSLPRQLILDNGGFDEDFPFIELDDVELAWRLSSAGAEGFFSREACAYAWRPFDIAYERRSHYQTGYSLFTLLAKIPDENLGPALKRTRVWRDTLSSFAWLPVCAQLCGKLSRETPTYSFLHRKLHRYELLHGYRDAAAGRAPATFTPK